jgi:hypothetical protein
MGVRMGGVRRVPPGEVARAAPSISRLGLFRHIFFPTRGRIIALPAPWVATQNALDSLPRTASGTVDGDRVDEILRTAREKAATAKGAANKVKRRRNHHLIGADKKDEESLHSLDESDSINEARRISQIHSFSNCSDDASAAAPRAMRTSQWGRTMR